MESYGGDRGEIEAKFTDYIGVNNMPSLLA